MSGMNVVMNAPDRVEEIPAGVQAISKNNHYIWLYQQPNLEENTWDFQQEEDTNEAYLFRTYPCYCKYCKTGQWSICKNEEYCGELSSDIQQKSGKYRIIEKFSKDMPRVSIRDAEPMFAWKRATPPMKKVLAPASSQQSQKKQKK